MGPVGFEHPRLKVSKTPISAKGDAKSDARNARKPSDSDQKLVQEQGKKRAVKPARTKADPPEGLQKLLQKLTASWDDLPDYVKTTIMTLAGLQR